MDQVCSFPYVVYYYVLYPTHIQRYQLTKKKKILILNLVKSIELL